MQTKFLFIPDWIIDSIKANKGQVTSILDFEYVKNILSPNDLAEFVYFSENASRMLMLEMTDSRTNPVKNAASDEVVSVSVLKLWNELRKGAPPLNSDVDKINSYIAINDCERSLTERLFAPVTLNISDRTFEVLSFDFGVMGVVISPGAFIPGQSDENRFLLIRTLVREMTRLNSQKEVARTLLMRRYIELLSIR